MSGGDEREAFGGFAPRPLVPVEAVHQVGRDAVLLQQHGDGAGKVRMQKSELRSSVSSTFEIPHSTFLGRRLAWACRHTWGAGTACSAASQRRFSSAGLSTSFLDGAIQHICVTRSVARPEVRRKDDSGQRHRNRDARSRNRCPEGFLDGPGPKHRNDEMWNHCADSYQFFRIHSRDV